MILDSSILIAAERRGETVRQIIERVTNIFGDVRAGLSTVSVVELTHGIYRAKTDVLRQSRKEFTDELCLDLIVYPVTLEIAQ